MWHTSFTFVCGKPEVADDRSSARPVLGRVRSALDLIGRDRATDVEGKRRDSMVWTLLSGDYPGSAAATAEVKAFDAMGRRIL